MESGSADPGVLYGVYGDPQGPRVLVLGVQWCTVGLGYVSIHTLYLLQPSLPPSLCTYRYTWALQGSPYDRKVSLGIVGVTE